MRASHVFVYWSHAFAMFYAHATWIGVARYERTKWAVFIPLKECANRALSCNLRSYVRVESHTRSERTHYLHGLYSNSLEANLRYQWRWSWIRISPSGSKSGKCYTGRKASLNEKYVQCSAQNTLHDGYILATIWHGSRLLPTNVGTTLCIR